MYKSISELAQINPGNSLPSGVRPMDNVSFIPMSDVSESGQWIGRQERSLRSVSSGFTSFSDNDVLVAKITPCFENGKGTHVTNLVNGAGFGSTEFHVLRAYPGVSPRFIHHVSQSAQLRRAGEAHMVGSAGQKRVPREFFDVFRVPDFSHDEQIKISHVLDTLDTTIRQTEAIIEKLKQVKQGLLHDLLTRGIDANGELRPPQSEAPELYKESALGWIPKEWAAHALGTLADVSGGVTLGRSISGPGVVELPYLRVANVQDGYLDLNEIKTVQVLSSEVPRYKLEPSDVLMNEGGDFDKLGRGVIWSGELETCLHQNHVFRVRCSRADLDPRYLAAYSASRFGKSYFVQASKQTTNLASINSTQLKAFPLMLPPPEEQRAIVEKLAGLDLRVESEARTRQKLLAQKSGLMDDLLTGRVRVTPLLESAAA
jgi:type I restriction enzyme, S subunit